MLKRILGTAGARLFITLVSFLVVIINARVLGAEGVGEISLIILGITIILLISNFAGGGSLVYLIPRYGIFKLLVPAYIWSAFSSIVGAILLGKLSLIPQGYTWHVLILSLLQSLLSTNLNMLLGKEKIHVYNQISVFQVIILICSLSWFYFNKHLTEVIFYIWSLYLSYSIALVLSALAIINLIKVTGFENLKDLLLQIFRYGAYVQVGNLVQLFNYRLGYYIIERYFGKGSLGVFTVGNQVSEGLWIFGKSVAVIQYSRISNTSDGSYHVQLTLRFVKIVFLTTLIMLLILLLIPDSVFIMIFRKDFTGIHPIILSLSSGIMAMSLSIILSHYFSGTGRHYHNAISAAIGLIMTLVFGFTLIPRLGLIGAGFTASISYTASALYQLITFIRISRVRQKDFLVRTEDFMFVIREIKSMIRKKADK